MASSLNPSSLFDVKGLVAVITGGGTGIGLMMAKALAINGAAKVYIIGRRKELLQNAAKSVDSGNIIPIVGDVTSKDSLEAIVSEITSEVGYINVLIANAGIGGPPAISTPHASISDFQSHFWNTPQDAYLETFKTNTASVWYTIIAFLMLLDAGNKAQNVPQKSQVIAIGSTAGFSRRTQGGFAYGQSKAALTHMMKQLATGLVPYGIRSNLIAPGLYPSERGDPFIAAFKGVFPKEVFPVERIGTEEDIAACVLYLTSRAGGYLNGSVMLTDGGALSMMPATY